ncbi:MAG: APC family permease [Actinomycetota bacterium]
MDVITRPVRHHPLKRIKRVLVGEPMGTERLIHERLGKPTALAVFASDNLSSSAYATEEVLRHLVPFIGAGAFLFTVPITIALLTVLAILLFSYRQTIKAYPQAGGAYLVTRDNFGILQAQFAGVALLTDYILTVSVSVAAGVAALTSVVPSTFPLRVWISLGFIALIAWGNLRGVKESGKIFAAPTYFFILMMVALGGMSIYRLATGTLQEFPSYPLPPEGQLQAVSVFMLLRAFSSGGAAVTGVEAISNGVPAFRQPEWKNARTTLMWMGTLLGSMVLLTSIMAVKIHVVPDPEEKVTVLAQIGRAVFGSSGVGTVAFIGLQVGTMLILVLAANTSFADFPRLASFHAGDHFLPRQLTRYGDRLVFSNGIIALSLLSALLVIMFKASVTRLIPLYAIGVFTSFTFSQSGMVVRHRRLRERGWRRGMTINGLGAVTTAVMTVVIAVTKFSGGAWIVLVSTPVILLLLLRVNHHYQETAHLSRDPRRTCSLDGPRQKIIVPINNKDPVDLYALAYGKRVFATEVIALHFAQKGSDGSGFFKQMEEVPVPKEVVLQAGSLDAALRSYARDARARLGQTWQVLNVIIPETVTTVDRFDIRYMLRRYRLQRLKAALMKEQDVVVTNLTLHTGYEALSPGAKVASNSRDEHWNHLAVLLVAAVHNGTRAGLRYAKSLGPDQLHCLHVSIDEEETNGVVERWNEEIKNPPLKVLESPYRQVTEPIFNWVRDVLERDPRTFVTIVIPEFVVKKRWHSLLHNKTALLLKGIFLFEPSVVVSAVPYRLHEGAETEPLVSRNH